ncbi:hypothetical protein HYH03_018034 [Edaphochlamys debaryana]|uniref:ATPase AAA-type core domain-containing protein n=1 Tax=Edaphochlamys debaryana TaxID=47281 RepID=A0A835XIU5_9CHLO|nr:hypothetical protein HYH03_018034 [Edaphochlamys debaryana]|eukprot:KAG2483096.1 hypothetical protein HYH03_018034 [Edaphochlamys debaryana]
MDSGVSIARSPAASDWLERRREELQSLGRRELQAQAKAMGVRANGKSADIVEAMIACEQGRSVKPADASRTPAAATDNVEEDGAATAEPHEHSDSENLAPTPPSPSPASKPSPSSLPPTKTPLAGLPPATPPPATTPVLPATTPSRTPGFAFARSALLTDLAARASAAALAASLQSMRLDSQLKATAAARGTPLAPHNPPAALPAQAQAQAQAQQPAGATPSAWRPAAAAGGSPSPAAPRPGLLFDADEEGAEEGAEERAGSAIDMDASDGDDGESEGEGEEEQEEGSVMNAGAQGREVRELGQGTGVELPAVGTPLPPPNHPAALEDTARRLAFAAASSPTAHAPSPLAASPAASASAASPAAPAANSPFPSPGPGGVAQQADPAPAPVQGASAAAFPALHVTDRTPMRQARATGAMLPPPGLAPAGTPFARPPGLLARTPGLGLRTPARRVAVCPDETQARADEAWCRATLLTAPAPPPPSGLAWEDMAGLGAARERLQALCFTTSPEPSAAAPASAPPPAAAKAPATPRGAAATSRAAAARKPGGGAAPSAPASGRSGGGSSSGASPTAAAPQAQAQAPQAQAPQRLPCAAVLLAGPRGVGKGLLARALAARMGGAYLRVPPDLAERVAAAQAAGGGGGGGAAPADVCAALRAVFRVASQAPGPVVVHLEDVECLAGAEAGPEGRRARTELSVAVEELLLSSATAPSLTSASSLGSSPAERSALRRSPSASRAIPSAAAAAGGSAAPPCAAPEGSGGGGGSTGGSGSGSSGGGLRAGVRVVVVATSSAPQALDEGLAACMGRSACLLAPLPDADARESLLLGRLLAAGAELGLEQLERLVRHSEGCSCAELAAACDLAVAEAEARRQGGQELAAPRPTLRERRNAAAAAKAAGAAAAAPSGRRPSAAATSGMPGVREEDLVAALEATRRPRDERAAAGMEGWMERRGLGQAWS